MEVPRHNLSTAPPSSCLPPPPRMSLVFSPVSCRLLSSRAFAHHESAPLSTEAEGARAQDWSFESASVARISALGVKASERE